MPPKTEVADPVRVYTEHEKARRREQSSGASILMAGRTPLACRDKGLCKDDLRTAWDDTRDDADRVFQGVMKSHLPRP